MTSDEKAFWTAHLDELLDVATEAQRLTVQVRRLESVLCRLFHDAKKPASVSQRAGVKPNPRQAASA